MPSTSKPRRSRSLPLQTTGAVTAPKTVKETVLCPAAPRRNVNNASLGHQTHGAVTPLTGAITNVSQLINGGVNVAKGSAGSFTSMADYTTFLRGLSLADLHRHAVEEARIVPIDDRERLIRRLETEWTATAARYPGRATANPIPSRAPFSREQIEAQAAIKRAILKQ